MDIVTNDVLTLAALVTSYVGIAKGFGLPSKFAPLVAIGASAVFVLLPTDIQSKFTLISVVGLTASGAYNYVKKRPDGNIPPSASVTPNGSGTDTNGGAGI